MAEPDYRVFQDKVALFRDLTERDIGIILSVSKMAKYRARSVLAQSGLPAEQAFVIVGGQVRLSSPQHHGVPTLIGDLFVGDVVGAVGLCDTRDYVFNAEAVTDVSALVVNREGLYALGATGEGAVYRFIRLLVPGIVRNAQTTLQRADALFQSPERGAAEMERLAMAIRSRA